MKLKRDDKHLADKEYKKALQNSHQQIEKITKLSPLEEAAIVLEDMKNRDCEGNILKMKEELQSYEKH